MRLKVQWLWVGIGIVLGAQSVAAESAIANGSAVQQTANPGITQLRAQGPAGLERFLKDHAQALQSTALPDPHLRTQLDALCKQRDCHASQLYWHTDLAKAQAEAQASNKPILSLRLLGNLDEELSCANSRFFRVALYPNAEVSQYLRERYVLHWESVRPAPVMTIDFGDGRQLKRTVTGNSIHYILDAKGRPFEALPGLYGPQAFLQHLQRAEALWKQTASLQEGEYQQALQTYHQQRLEAIQTNWTQDLQTAGIKDVPVLQALPDATKPNAVDAAPIAVTKSLVEIPLVSSSMSLSTLANQNRDQLNEATQPQTWGKLAEFQADRARLDENSKSLMRSKHRAYHAPETLAKTVKSFEQAMAIDTVRNEYLLHSRIHQWFVERNQTGTIYQLNEKVYADLFLTPSSDPWLGLVSPDIYSAIEGDGIEVQ
ncbi:hypothetical protein [Acaryochloris marina]|uniref:Uncharacterized protein n=1 Tax=Acaryochloris marina (strain MBIC 11017) TaxID=329726 RepID=B0CDT8_ACAM1|nr:hypothetical protein [Acaryochloris marina]ABW29290.1 hypothetical protein AM1_4311 [Acaryochloris marina MBIC11017]BDM78213.1 hypothetical protein AM10699_10830 [Acaryochloris marina MBIC10699]